MKVGRLHQAAGEIHYGEIDHRGQFTHEYVKGLVGAPEDREPASELIESAGAKLINFYFTTGDSDFVCITEANNDAEAGIAAMLGAAAAGTISDISTARAWTGAEFKAVAEKASKAGKAYRSPGER